MNDLQNEVRVIGGRYGVTCRSSPDVVINDPDKNV